MLALHHRRARRAALCCGSPAAAVGGDIGWVGFTALWLSILRKRFTAAQTRSR